MKVSVIVPIYNQAVYLPETLDSVMAQSFTNWECVIVDDGSTDNTGEVAEIYTQKDNRFKYFKKENTGLGDTRNYGIKKAQGQYILPLDSDDKIALDYLKEAVVIMENNPTIKVVHTYVELFGVEKGFWHRPEYSLKRLLYQNVICSTALFRKSDFLQTEGYSDDMKGGFEDWEFWISLLETGGSVYKIPKAYFFYRIRRNSMARSMDEKLIKELKLRIYKKHIDSYLKYWETPFELFDYKENYLALTHSKEYKIMKLIYKPIKMIRKFLKI